MIKYFFTVLLLSNIYFLNAQDRAYLDIGNVRALINSNGVFFSNAYISAPSYEVPKGSNSHSIFSSAIWIMDKKESNNKLIISGTQDRYGQSLTNEFSGYNIGPVDIINQKADSSAIFQRLWKIDQAEIDSHIQNWNNSNYTMPASIQEWPGDGNSNTADNLAPYADLDFDNIYEPQDGEYPIIKGDQAIYLILNDYRDPDISIDSLNPKPLPDTSIYKSANIEVHHMLYAFNSPTVSISNAVFVNTKIINRSNSTANDLNDLRVSIFTDFDLGYPFDDFVGTDSSRNMVYAYNGDNFDESWGGLPGYGNQLVAQGVVILDKSLYSSIYFNNSPGQNGDPTLPVHFANYQRSKWKDDSPVFFGGNGYSYCTDTNQATNYMYSGDPTLLNDTNQWTELNPCMSSNAMMNAPSDRRMVGTADLPNQLLHGDTLVVDYAYVFARDNDSSTHSSDPVADLFLAADTVQNFYDSLVVTSISEHVQNGKGPSFNLYPNPSTHRVNLEIDANVFNLTIYDFNGRLVKELKNEKHFSINELSNGIYLVKITAEGLVMSRKLLVQH